MAANPLGEYVAGRIRAGQSKTDIREELLAVGWSEEEADVAYRDGLLALGIPVPREGDRPALAKKASTVDIVVNFFSFVLLTTVATGLGALYFQVVNRNFPDPLSAMADSGDLALARSIHYAIASLVIAFPLYVLTMRLWFRKFREDEGRTESRLSRWLTYIVLLIGSVTIVGDLITVLFKLLQGEMSVRFLLKAAIILVIAGLVFSFYYLERRKIQYHQSIPRSTFLKFGWIVSGIVAFGIVVGFLSSGSPATARQRAFDLERARNLDSLATCIESHARDLGELPVSLDQLVRNRSYSHCAASMHDPETSREYEYRVVTASRAQGPAKVAEFELCATFDLASKGTRRRGYYAAGTGFSLWDTHGAGRSCDVMTVQLVGKKPLPSIGE